LKSTDGFSWFLPNNGKPSWNLDYIPQHIAYAEKQYIAVGQQIISTSSDGENWNQHPVNNTYYSITHGSNGYVAVGQAAFYNNGSPWIHSYYATSTNANDWNERTVQNGNQPNAVTYGNGVYVAVGVGIETSFDGQTWTQRWNPQKTPTGYEDSFLKAVVWSEKLKLFVAGGLVSPYMLTSPDGIHWTEVPQAKSRVGAFSWSDSLNLFAGLSDQGILTSPDGIHWTTTNYSTSDWSILEDIAAGDGFFLIVGWDINTTPQSILLRFTPQLSK